jgi:hypothetical protein
MKRLILALGLAVIAFLSPALSRADDHPTWWPALITEQQPADDDPAARVSQLKALAVGLFDHMEAHFPGGAGKGATSIVKSWFKLNRDGSFQLDQAGKRLLKATSQDDGTVQFKELKRVAKPFYDQLMSRYFARAYPWQQNPERDLADATIIHLAELKRAFDVDVIRNSDSDRMPDLYERASGFDHLTANDDEDDDDDGRSNYHEFNAGSDPLVAPGKKLVVTRVNNKQEVFEDSYLGEPLILRITNGDKPIPNLPVTFTVSSGHFADWRTTPPKDRSRVFVQATNEIGEAAAEYRAPVFLESPVTITASVLYGGRQHEYTFTTVFTPADPGAPNGAPANFKIELAGPNSLYFTWTDTSTDEDGFTLSFKSGDQPWEELVDLPPNTTSYLLESPMVGPNIQYLIQSFKN